MPVVSRQTFVYAEAGVATTDNAEDVQFGEGDVDLGAGQPGAGRQRRHRNRTSPQGLPVDPLVLGRDAELLKYAWGFGAFLAQLGHGTNVPQQCSWQTCRPLVKVIDVTPGTAPDRATERLQPCAASFCPSSSPPASRPSPLQRRTQ